MMIMDVFILSKALFFSPALVVGYVLGERAVNEAGLKVE
jgi:hypothetical protein